MFSADNRSPQSTQSPIDHPNPKKSLATIEIKLLLKSPKSMVVSDDHWS
jgi:hypothetical protein